MNAPVRFFVLMSHQIDSFPPSLIFFSFPSKSYKIPVIPNHSPRDRILRALLAPQVYYLTCRVASLTAVLTFRSLTPRNKHLKCAPLFGRSRSSRMRATRRMRPTELMRQGFVADPACRTHRSRHLASSHVVSLLIRESLLTLKNHFDCM